MLITMGRLNYHSMHALPPSIQPSGTKAADVDFTLTHPWGGLFCGVLLRLGRTRLGAFFMFLFHVRSWVGTFYSVWVGALRNELAFPKGPAEREQQVKRAAEFRGCPMEAISCDMGAETNIYNSGRVVTMGSQAVMEGNMTF